MNIIIFQGIMGSGKTNGMVLLAKYIESLSNENVTLYSNFEVKGTKDFTSLYDFYDVTEQKSSIVMLDETHVDLDSRSFSSNHVKFVSQTAFYLRKMRCTLMLTSPLYENLDSRIRGVTIYVIDVRNKGKYFYYDIFDGQTGRFKKTLRVNKNMAFQLNFYDTNNIVTPLEVPEKKPEFDEFLIELKYRVNKYYGADGRSEQGSRLA